MTPRITRIALTLLSLILVASTASAGEWPHERDGWTIGANLGGGNAELEWKLPGLTVNESETGGAGNFRAGYALTPKVALGLETALWLRTYEIAGSSAEVTVTFDLVGPAGWFYPGANGWFVRGAIGSGSVTVEITDGGLTVEGSESGFGGLVGGGYEWRLTRTFALGAELDVVAFSIDDVLFTDADRADLTVTLTNITAAFNWYF